MKNYNEEETLYREMLIHDIKTSTLALEYKTRTLREFSTRYLETIHDRIMIRK